MTTPAQPPARLRRQLERLALDDAVQRVRADLQRDAQGAGASRLVIPLAALLFAVVFAWRLAVDDPNALIANFYTVPIALLAVVYGVRAGLIGTVVATGLVGLWDVVTPVEVGPLGYVSRAAVALLVGVVVGRSAERLRADIARRREAERELALRADDLARSNARLEQAVRRLDALATIAGAVGSETDLRRSLGRIAEQGRELAGCASLEVRVRHGGELVPIAAAPPGATVAERSAVVVPLRYRDEDLGTLAARPTPGEAPPDAVLLEAIAASAATAVATARTVAAERLRDAIAASERERRRWAWELHDQTLQGLVGLRVTLSTALADGDPRALGAAVERALEEIRLETSNLKHLIAELRPAALDELGLGAALAGLCDQVAGTSGVEVAREIGLGDAEIPPETQTAVYRVVQEALTNVAKHAGAERVAVAVHARDAVVDVEVRDDGHGFDPAAEHGGFGLHGMCERVEAAGGRLAIEAGPGGTRIRASLPSRASGPGLALSDDRPG